MPTMRSVWILGGVILVGLAGTARADSGSPTAPAATESPSGAQNSNAAATTTPACRDLGVTVSFQTGSHELDQNGKGALDGVAQWLNANNDRTLKLRGYADTTG